MLFHCLLLLPFCCLPSLSWRGMTEAGGVVEGVAVLLCLCWHWWVVSEWVSWSGYLWPRPHWSQSPQLAGTSSLAIAGLRRGEAKVMRTGRSISTWEALRCSRTRPSSTAPALFIWTHFKNTPCWWKINSAGERLPLSTIQTIGESVSEWRTWLKDDAPDLLGDQQGQKYHIFEKVCVCRREMFWDREVKFYLK